MSTIKIARCRRHGLHGERDSCYICNGEVDQVEMVEATEVEAEGRAISTIAIAMHNAGRYQYSNETDLDALAEAVAKLADDYDRMEIDLRGVVRSLSRILSYPRWSSIGALDNTATISMSRDTYNAAQRLVKRLTS